jgi:hypothetical protein
MSPSRSSAASSSRFPDAQRPRNRTRPWRGRAVEPTTAIRPDFRKNREQRREAGLAEQTAGADLRALRPAVLLVESGLDLGDAIAIEAGRVDVGQAAALLDSIQRDVTLRCSARRCLVSQGSGSASALCEFSGITGAYCVWWQSRARSSRLRTAAGSRAWDRLLARHMLVDQTRPRAGSQERF